MTGTPRSDVPLGVWLNATLGTNHDRLTAPLIRWSLGNEAEHAFTFDGADFLIDFLESYSSRGPAEHTFVSQGVTELLDNLDLPQGRRHFGALERQTEMRHNRVAETDHRPPTSMQEAIDAAEHFYVLARACLERAKFGGPERAADIACFETFRVAAIACTADGESSPSQAELLTHIMSWHHASSPDARAELPVALVAGVELVTSSIAESAHHSLVLQITATNKTLEARLRSYALRLIDAMLRLDGLAARENAAPGSGSREEGHNANLTEDLELVSKSMFIIPRGRGGRLAPKPEFDRLWAIYRTAVPWSTADRTT